VGLQESLNNIDDRVDDINKFSRESIDLLELYMEKIDKEEVVTHGELAKLYALALDISKTNKTIKEAIANNFNYVILK